MGDRLRNLVVSQIHRSNIFYFNKKFKSFFSYKNFKQNQGWYERLFSAVVSILRVLFILPLFASCNTFCCWYWKKQIWRFFDFTVGPLVCGRRTAGLSCCVLKWVRETWIGEGATSTGSKLANNRKHSVRHKERSCWRLWRWGGGWHLNGYMKWGSWLDDHGVGLKVLPVQISEMTSHIGVSFQFADERGNTNISPASPSATSASFDGVLTSTDQSVIRVTYRKTMNWGFEVWGQETWDAYTGCLWSLEKK